MRSFHSQQNGLMKIRCALAATTVLGVFFLELPIQAQTPQFQAPKFQNTPVPHVQPSGNHPGLHPHHAAIQEMQHDWAMSLQQRLHERAELEEELGLNELPNFLRDEFQLPTTIDQDAMRIAGITPSSTTVRLLARETPLRVALTHALQPLNLKFRLTEFGLTISADFTRLARQGIATDRWADISLADAKQIEADLEQSVSFEGQDVPLKDAVSMLGQQIGSRIAIDVFALEGEGLSDDVPVSARISDAKFASAMSDILRDHGLTLEFRNGHWLVTTLTDAEDELLNRVYYLEATGMTESLGQAMETIQTSVEPDTWEVLGGVGTMAPLPFSGSNRPGLIVSTTFGVHLKIEALLDAVRAGTVGADTPTKVNPGGHSSQFHSGWNYPTPTMMNPGAPSATAPKLEYQPGSHHVQPPTHSPGGMF
ncbi:hypothetical protein LOC71_01960 [Rhodopirellula sp. JC740]|uniref:Uncharacterized protein n=1 Tax=Rhodopirellula halodulae TaxID=2894198 RepID=A0ABS8NEY7_9BACT|nr:hypothetical protein [Rhodopirellula sp. JC740]MCC9641021.1 hypothetical protein [Rhodopirellula sp. JC740]